MKSSENNIAEYIKSGRYFKDARDWYSNKFILPIAEKAWLVLFAFVMSAVSFIVIVNINNILPMTKKFSVMVDVQDIFRNNTKVKNVNYFPNDPEKTIAQHLIYNFLKMREQYKFENIERQQEIIKNISGKLVAESFNKLMQIDNPESLLAKYQDKITRFIEPQKITFNSDNQAIIIFDAYEKAPGKSEYYAGRFKADIYFEMSELEKTKNANDKFKFIVTEYNSTKIN